MKVSDSLPVCPPPHNNWAGSPLAPQHPQPQHAHQVGAIGDALLAMKITTDLCEFDREDNFTAFKKNKPHSLGRFQQSQSQSARKEMYLTRYLKNHIGNNHHKKC